MARRTLRNVATPDTDETELEDGSGIEMEVVNDTPEEAKQVPAAQKKRASARREEAEAEETAPVPKKKPTTALATKAVGFKLKGLVGDFSVGVFEVPTLKLLQKGSPEADADAEPQGDPDLVGTFSINGENLGTEVEVIMLKSEVKFREKVEKDGEMGRTFDTRDEAKEACGLNWDPIAVADVLVYVESNPEQTFEEGETVRFARFYFQGTSYQSWKNLNTQVWKAQCQYWDRWLIFKNTRKASGTGKKQNVYRKLLIELSDQPTSEALREYAETWVDSSSSQD